MSDLRHALRLLMTQPGLTCPVVLALALGIGVNTTIFGFVDGLLFRPLPVERLDEVVRVTAVEREHPDDHFNSSYPVFTDYRDGAKSFAALAAYADDNAVHMSLGAGAPERLTGALVSGRFFEVLGTRAWRGRLLGPDDDRVAGRHPVAVISYGLWRRVFGGSDEVIGRTVRLNNHPFTIVGVTPPGVVGVSLDTLPDLWTPMAMAGQIMPEIAREFGVLDTRRFSWLEIVGRLKPGVTVAQAQAELDAIATHRAAAQPAQDRDPFAGVVPVEQLVTGTETGTQYKTMSWVLLGVVGLVLLIACADAAGLLLVRAEQRQREMAVRAAMGATRWRLVRQLLTESLLLAGVATLAGLLVALWSAEALLAVLPSDFPLAPAARGPIGEPRVLLFTLASALVAALAFGLAPAWRASRPNLVPALKQDTPMLGRARRLSLRHAFVVGQIALCVLLLVGAGLLLRTVRAFGAIAPGFETERVLVASVDVALQGYDEARGRRFFEDVNASIASLPGVAHAALGRMVPVDLQRDARDLRRGWPAEGRPDADGRFQPGDPRVLRRPGHSDRAGPRFHDRRQPRGAAGRDRQPRAGRTLLPGPQRRRSAPGRVRTDGHRRRDRRRRRQRALSQPARRGRADDLRGALAVLHAAHVAGRPDDAAAGDDAAGAGGRGRLDRPGPAAVPDTDDARAVAGQPGRRAPARLAAVGLCGAGGVPGGGRPLRGGVVHDDAAHARVRHPRGAGRDGEASAAAGLGQTLWLVGIGLAVGLALALASARALSSLLFGVGPTDVATYLAVGVLLLSVGVAAAQWPARRAARVNPSSALRAD